MSPVTARLTGSWPGGKKILQRVAGKDASKQFWKYHNEGILKKYKPQLQIGSLDSKPKEEKKAAKPKVEAQPKPQPIPTPAPKDGKPVSTATEEEAEALEPYGAQIPFGDPNWYQGVSHALRRP
jgi:hypothetical protein